jgi:hypothetical protein
VPRHVKVIVLDAVGVTGPDGAYGMEEESENAFLFVCSFLFVFSKFHLFSQFLVFCPHEIHSLGPKPLRPTCYSSRPDRK